MRRSSPPYKKNRRFLVGWNVGERKPHKCEADCGFSNPEGANSARSAYCLLNEGKTYYEAARMDAGGLIILFN